MLQTFVKVEVVVHFALVNVLRSREGDGEVGRDWKREVFFLGHLEYRLHVDFSCIISLLTEVSLVL